MTTRKVQKNTLQLKARNAKKLASAIEPAISECRRDDHARDEDGEADGVDGSIPGLRTTAAGRLVYLLVRVEPSDQATNRERRYSETEDVEKARIFAGLPSSSRANARRLATGAASAAPVRLDRNAFLGRQRPVRFSVRPWLCTQKFAVPPVPPPTESSWQSCSAFRSM
jgi:hypothetical protein